MSDLPPMSQPPDRETDPQGWLLYRNAWIATGLDALKQGLAKVSDSMKAGDYTYDLDPLTWMALVALTQTLASAANFMANEVNILNEEVEKATDRSAEKLISETEEFLRSQN